MPPGSAPSTREPIGYDEYGNPIFAGEGTAPSPGLGGVPAPVESVAPPLVEPPPNPPPSPDQYMPGPPRNYVPGSTYIPQHPEPTWEQQLEERSKPPPINRTMVPGVGGYRGSPQTYEIPYVSPGLGQGNVGAGPLSAEGRGLAPDDPETWDVVDPREPQMEQPGSTYVPERIGKPPIGDPRRVFAPSASKHYGGDAPPPRLPEQGRIDTMYPASGDTPTFRYLLDPDGEVMLEGNAPPREVVPGYGIGKKPNTPYRDPGDTLTQMEYARRERFRPIGMAGLFGARHRSVRDMP